MQGITYAASSRQAGNVPPFTGISTTLYDLMEAIHEEVRPGEEALVTDIVLRLMDRGRMKFLDHPTARSAHILSSLCALPRGKD